MNTYITCSNEYGYLLEPFSILFNKYWPGQQVVALCYDIPNLKLPDNFQMVSIGTQGKYWSDALIPFFIKCKDDYFILNLEDMFLVDYVKPDLLSRLEERIKNGTADKAMLHFCNPTRMYDENTGFLAMKQNADYRFTIHPSIWSRKYLLKSLRPSQTVWDFETSRFSYNDGGNIICTKEQGNKIPVFLASNMYVKGKTQSTGWGMFGNDDNGLMHEEDIEILKRFRK